jgi:hypothetical protein
MNTYFNNGGIIENLPLNPINKNLKTSIYIVGSLAILATIGCIATCLQLDKLQKDLARLQSLSSNETDRIPPDQSRKPESLENDQAKDIA